MPAFCSLDAVSSGHIFIPYMLSFKATQDSKLISVPVTYRCPATCSPLYYTKQNGRHADSTIDGSPAGLLSILGRLIFRMSGMVYSGSFIRAARLTSDQSILEIGCGMGTILTATRRRLASTSTYLGI